jgi:hypothetical protein
MRWALSHQADPKALRLADRHYSRGKKGSPQFMPPGRQVVLITPQADALWACSWPDASMVKRAWPGAWMCTLFRNESPHKASELIIEAVAATRGIWGEPPDSEGFSIISIIDTRKVKPTKVRGKDVWGWTWLKAGWELAGATKKLGLPVFGLRVARVPLPEPCLGQLFTYQSTVMGEC